MTAPICPLPLYADGHDEEEDLPFAHIRPCGATLMFNTVNGGELYDDLSMYEAGEMWQITCVNGHVLAMNHAEGDIPSDRTGYTPAVGSELLRIISSPFPRFYDGPIEVGMTFLWQPLVPNTTQHLCVEAFADGLVSTVGYEKISDTMGVYRGSARKIEEQRFRNNVMHVPQSFPERPWNPKEWAL